MLEGGAEGVVQGVLAELEADVVGVVGVSDSVEKKSDMDLDTVRDTTNVNAKVGQELVYDEEVVRSPGADIVGIFL